LIEIHGFTGEHLNWHESPTWRRAAAKPTISLLPPPLESVSVSHRRSPVKYYGEHGQPISWTEWRELQMAAWTARESNPEVIDTIGISETVLLAEARLQGIVPDYILAWSAETDGDSEKFAQLLERIRESVTSEVSDLWRKSEWHTAWFERACRKKVEDALAAQVKTWKSTARKFEIQDLENPHLSLESLLSANGDVAFAATLEQGKKTIEASQNLLSTLREELPKTNAQVIGGGLRSEANRNSPEDGGAIPSVQEISPRSIPSQQRMGGSPAEIYPEAAVSRRSVGTPSVDLQRSFPPTRHSFSGGPADPTQRAGLYKEIGWLTRKIQVVEGPAGLPSSEALDRLLDRVTGEKTGELGRVHTIKTIGW
jgi:uncharacterized protein YukE